MMERRRPRRLDRRRLAASRSRRYAARVQPERDRWQRKRPWSETPEPEACFNTIFFDNGSVRAGKASVIACMRSVIAGKGGVIGGKGSAIAANGGVHAGNGWGPV